MKLILMSVLFILTFSSTVKAQLLTKDEIENKVRQEVKLMREDFKNTFKNHGGAGLPVKTLRSNVDVRTRKKLEFYLPYFDDDDIKRSRLNTPNIVELTKELTQIEKDRAVKLNKKFQDYEKDFSPDKYMILKLRPVTISLDIKSNNQSKDSVHDLYLTLRSGSTRLYGLLNSWKALPENQKVRNRLIDETFKLKAAISELNKKIREFESQENDNIVYFNRKKATLGKMKLALSIKLRNEVLNRFKERVVALYNPVLNNESLQGRDISYLGTQTQASSAFFDDETILPTSWGDSKEERHLYAINQKNMIFVKKTFSIIAWTLNKLKITSPMINPSSYYERVEINSSNRLAGKTEQISDETTKYYKSSCSRN